MKRAICLMLCLCFCGVNMASANEYDFRKVKWGMSKKEVIESEGRVPDYSQNNSMLWRININRKECVLGYVFIDGKLTRSAYILSENYINKNNYIDDYKIFKSELMSKYGEPYEEENVWLNDLYIDDYSSYGLAISIGHNKRWASWKAGDTEIDIMISGSQYEIVVKIEYTGVKYKEMEKNYHKQKVNEIF